MDEIDLDDSTIADERLELIFTCCHPALAVEAQVALTLRALGGLTTEEIARAFLVLRGDDEAPAVAGQGQDQGHRRSRSPSRPTACCRTAWRRCWRSIYLIFNEGYTDRGDLAAEAIRLGRLLAELMADEPEVYGLLALMLLHDSRRAARVVDGRADPAGRAGPLPARPGEGRRRPGGARASAGAATAAGPYVLQAAIASLQAEADIDWDEVAAALRTARAAHRLAGRRPQPRGGGRRGRRARAGARARRLARSRRVPLPALDPGRAAAPSRPRRRGPARRSSAPCELAATDPERRFLVRRLSASRGTYILMLLPRSTGRATPVT